MQLDAATKLNEQVENLFGQGRYAEAVKLEQQVLAIREQILGPDHPDVATSLKYLAGLYRDLGKYSQAEPLYHRALKIDEKALGPEHPELAIDLTNLALLFTDQGKYAEAEPLFQRALRIAEKLAPPRSSECCLCSPRTGRVVRAAKQIRSSRATDATGIEDSGNCIRAGSINRWPQASTISRKYTATKANTPRRSRSTSGP